MLKQFYFLINSRVWSGLTVSIHPPVGGRLMHSKREIFLWFSNIIHTKSINVHNGLLVLSMFVVISGCYRGIKLPEPIFPVTYIEKINVQSEPKVIWSKKQSSPIAAMEIINPNTLFITTHRGEVYLIDLETGDRNGKVWQPFYAGITSYIIDRSANLLFLASRRDKRILSYNMDKKRSKWKKTIKDMIGRIAVSKDNLYVCLRSGEILAFDKYTGKKVTQVSLKSSIFSGIDKWQDQYIVITDDGRATAFSPELKKQWSIEVGMNTDIIILPNSASVLFISTNGRISQFDPTENILTDIRSELSVIYTHPVIFNDIILLAYAKGKVEAINLENTASIWKYNEEQGLLNHSIQVSDSVCVVPYARGNIIGLDINTGKELWQYNMEHTLRHILTTPQGIVVADSKKNLMLLR